MLRSLRTYLRGYRRRIVVSLILFLFAIFVPLVHYGIRTDRALIAESIETTGKHLVKNLAQNSELGVFTENRGYLDVPLRAIFSQEDVVWAAVYNDKGEVLLERHTRDGFNPQLSATIVQTLDRETWHDVLVQPVCLSTENVLDFFYPVYLRSGTVAPEYEHVTVLEQRQRCIGVARIGLSLARVRQRTLAIINTAFVFSAVYLVAALFAVWFVARAITRPVRQLEAAARTIGSGNLDVRITPQADDELGALAATFNAMADQLKQQMEQRQQAEEQMLRLIQAVEQAAEMVIVFDKNGCVQYANPATRKVIGITQKELVGLNPFKLERPSTQAALVERVWQEISAGNIWSGSMAQRLEDGIERQLEQTIAPVRDNRGDIIGFVAIGRDVTHEHMLEQRLRQAQKMEAIGTLAGGIAHDFNNILAAIIGYTELSCAHKNLEPGIRYNLEQILKASNRAADLVRQILAFSRKSMHEKRPVMLNTLLKESLQLLRATIPTTIEMRLELPPQPLTILADASQIHQVVMNLCTNAYQAIGDQQGTITVRLTDCEQAPADLAGYPDLQLGRYACLTVADNGPGITPEVIEHIFEPFFTTKPVDKGTGMGLAVVDGIVRTHHGAIRVTSQPGAGATFDIFFPLLEHPETECTASHEMVLKGNSEHILFVDDEATLVETGKQLLERLGYQVTATQSSSHALALIEENPGRFQVIITDQTMPGISGIELARKVKKINPELPVILCSGYSDVVTPEGAAAEGIEAFLYKPVDKHILAAALRTALEKTKSVNQKSGNGTVDA